MIPSSDTALHSVSCTDNAKKRKELICNNADIVISQHDNWNLWVWTDKPMNK